MSNNKFYRLLRATKNVLISRNYRTMKYISYARKKNANSFLRKIAVSRLSRRNITMNINEDTTEIKDLYLPHPYNIAFGAGAQIGKGCTIYQEVTIGQNKGKYPIIGDNVIIYPGAKVIGDIKVGSNAIIGANAVVTADVPDNAIVAGIPAKVLKYRKSSDIYF